MSKECQFLCFKFTMKKFTSVCMCACVHVKVHIGVYVCESWLVLASVFISLIPGGKLLTQFLEEDRTSTHRKVSQ